MKPTVKCPECYSIELYNNGKDKKANQKYYLWICIDSETRFITSWNLNKSREAECAFSFFKQAKCFGNPKSIFTDGLPSYR